jgi:hypothetical protein
MTGPPSPSFVYKSGRLSARSQSVELMDVRSLTSTLLVSASVMKVQGLLAAAIVPPAVASTYTVAMPPSFESTVTAPFDTSSIEPSN